MSSASSGLTERVIKILQKVSELAGVDFFKSLLSKTSEAAKKLKAKQNLMSFTFLILQCLKYLASLVRETP
jgi:hypothetical protein